MLRTAAESRQVKRQKLQEEPEEKESEQKEPEQKVEPLVQAQMRINDLENEQTETVAALVREYNAQKAPLYAERQRLIDQIPKFWSTVLLSWQSIEGMLDEKEERALQFLQKVHVHFLEKDPDDFKLTFTFAPNPYFKNTELWKCIEATAGAGTTGQENGEEEERHRITASGIDWKNSLQAGELKAIAEAAVTPDEDEDNPDGHGSLLALFLPQDKNKELADLIRTELFPDPVAVYQEVLHLEVEEDEA